MMTKKQVERAYEQWCKSRKDELYKAYGKPSAAKWRAWEHCREACYVLGGHGLRIISHNTYMFTAGFVYEKDGQTKFMYITPTYKETIDVVA